MARRKRFSREQVLGAIQEWLVEHGMPPTVEELRLSLKLGSTRTALRYLRWLEEEGDIERWRGARGLRLLRSSGGGMQTRDVPLVGTISAGPLMVAEESIEGWVRVAREFVSSGAKYFFLRVRGDSMNKARLRGGTIEDGDLALVRQQVTADPGEVVVAIFDGEATIKRLVAGKDYWVLKPESSNRKHRPILVDQDFRIQGVVVRVFREGSELFNLSS